MTEHAFNDRDRALLVALADGKLSGRRRAAALAIVLPSGGTPNTADFADVGLLPATQPAPKALADRPQELNTSFEGVSYPNWAHEFGWHATGARSGTVDGRATRTVYYQHMEHRIGYTVVSGKPLAPPRNADRITRNDVQIALYRDRNAAVFIRNGHTCVLSARHLMHRS